VHLLGEKAGYVSAHCGLRFLKMRNEGSAHNGTKNEKRGKKMTGKKA